MRARPIRIRRGDVWATVGWRAARRSRREAAGDRPGRHLVRLRALLDLDDLVVLGDQAARRLGPSFSSSWRLRDASGPGPRADGRRSPLLRTRSCRRWRPGPGWRSCGRGCRNRCSTMHPDAADGGWRRATSSGRRRRWLPSPGAVHAGFDRRAADNGRRLLVEDDDWHYVELFAADILRPAARATARPDGRCSASTRELWPSSDLPPSATSKSHDRTSRLSRPRRFPPRLRASLRS